VTIGSTFHPKNGELVRIGASSNRQKRVEKVKATGQIQQEGKACGERKTPAGDANVSTAALVGSSTVALRGYSALEFAHDNNTPISGFTNAHNHS
jgi:hypothetical protein